MSQKLYVGGLNAATNDAGLREAFAEYGEITEATVITHRDSGASRGFGFVTFTEAASGEKAITARNRTMTRGVISQRNRGSALIRPANAGAAKSFAIPWNADTLPPMRPRRRTDSVRSIYDPLRNASTLPGVEAPHLFRIVLFESNAR